MLAGDGAAHFHAQRQDLGAERFGAVEFVRDVGVEQDQRMQVAVARMEHVGAAQAVLVSIAAMPASTSPRRLRGMVPSMQ
jgi:hypothetical protein